jgi:hypothetical protein
MRSRSSPYPSLFALTPLPATGAAADAHSRRDEFHWRGVLAAGQRVAVKGVVGTIRAEAADGPEAEVRAIRTAGRTGRAEDVRIEQVPSPEGMTIRAVYPSAQGARENRFPPEGGHTAADEGSDVRVDFVVRVPAGVDFVGETVNGTVRAESLPADATVASVNGDVVVSAAGTVEAATVNGSIDATTGRADPGRDLRFSTVNGNILLRVPPGFGARVQASLTHGSIGGDFPLAVTRQQLAGRTASGDVGGGGHALQLSTVNGSIEIRRSGSAPR